MNRDRRHWTSTVASAADLVAAVPAIAADPGIDVAWDDLLEGEPLDADADDVLLRHVRATAEGLRDAFASAPVLLHRAIGVDDPAAFVRSLGTRDLGIHWTDDRACADDRLHGGEATRTTVVVEALVPASSVCWASTMQMRVAHPSEREITVHGPVLVARILDTSDATVATPGIDAPCHLDGDDGR